LQRTGDLFFCAPPNERDPTILSACGGDKASNDEPLSSWLAQGVLIDSRTLGEFNQGHLDRAILVPNDQLSRRIATLAPTKDTPILLYCQSGGRAGTAEKMLREMGYTKVKNLGGIRQARRALAD
jgi:phage shock protein E